MRQFEGETSNDIFNRNSLFFKANIKVSFVALNQIRNDSKDERDFKKIVFGQFRDCSHAGAYCLAEFNSCASRTQAFSGHILLNFRRSEPQVSTRAVRCSFAVR